MATQIASAKKLIINKLTQAQYDSIPEKDPAQLYLITDAEVSGGASGFTKEEADEFYVFKDESGAAMFDMISRTQGQITVPDKPGTLALLSDLEGLSGGEGVLLPEQTGNTGKFLYTDGNNLSWANAIKNNANDTAENGSIAIGGGATCEGGGVCIGIGSDCRSGVSIGNYTYSTAAEAIAIGYGANATASGAIQIGGGTNTNEKTFSVGLFPNNYTLLTANGLIPSERLATGGSTGQVLAKTDTGLEWKDVESSGGSVGLTEEQADLLYAKKDDTGAVEIKEIYNSEGYHIAIPDQGNLAADDSSTYAATTAWVQRAIDNKLSGIESILDELNGETLEG